jgi:hypothetical protein
MTRRAAGSNQYRTRYRRKSDPDSLDANLDLLEQQYRTIGEEMAFQETLYQMRQDPDPSPIEYYLDKMDSKLVRAYLAGHPDCPLPLLDELSQDVEMEVRAQALAHPQCPRGAMWRVLDQRQDLSEATAVARNPSCPDQLLHRLAMDLPQLSLRQAVLQNPNCSAHTVIELTRAQDARAASLALRHPKLPVSVIRRMWTGALPDRRSMLVSNPDRRAAVAGNPNCPQDLVRIAAIDGWRLVRMGAADNPNCPPDVLVQLLADESESVRDRALLNPNLPEEYRALHRSVQ